MDSWKNYRTQGAYFQKTTKNTFENLSIPSFFEVFHYLEIPKQFTLHAKKNIQKNLPFKLCKNIKLLINGIYKIF